MASGKGFPTFSQDDTAGMRVKCQCWTSFKVEHIISLSVSPAWKLCLTWQPGYRWFSLQGVTTIRNRQCVTFNTGGIVAPPPSVRDETLYSIIPPPPPTTTTTVSQSFVVNGHLTSQERRVSRACAEARFAANAEAASQVISFGPCLTVAAPEAIHHPGDNEGMRDAKSGLCRGFHFCDVWRGGRLWTLLGLSSCNRIFFTDDGWMTLWQSYQV